MVGRSSAPSGQASSAAMVARATVFTRVGRASLPPARRPSQGTIEVVHAGTRARIAEYVKPLAVGLDGMTYYGDVERVIEASRRIAVGVESVDEELLYLLAVFSGQEKWVSRFGHKSRTEIFLASLGVPARKIALLWRGLGRLERAPSTPEEEAVHDAVRL